MSDDDVGTPELEQLGLLEVDMDWMEAVGGKLSHSPTSGKEEGTSPRSMQADRERNERLLAPILTRTHRENMFRKIYGESL